MGPNISVGSKYSSSQYSRDLENVIKYATGTNIITPEEGPLDGMGIMVGIGVATDAFKGGQWLWSNRKDTKGAWATFAEEAKLKSNAFNEAGGWKNPEAYKLALREHNAKTIAELIPQGDKFTSLSKETQGLYLEAQKATELAVKNPLKIKDAFKLADEKLALANAKACVERIAMPAKGFWGKLVKGFKQYSGLSHIDVKLKSLAVKSPMTAKLLKYGKGNGLFLAITGVAELFTQVIPAFNIGPDKGIKQIGKSSVKTAASIGGWVAGSAIAAKGGAMAGAAIGSAFPGVGTVVGGVVGSLVGLVGGCLGAWAVTKVAKGMIGEDEVEIEKEKQAKLLASNAGKSPEQTQQLIMTAAQKLQTEGVESEDAKIAFKSLQKLAPMFMDKSNSGNNPFA